MQIGNKNFNDRNKVYVMGILNLTPDSFFDGGQFNSKKKALIQTEKMIAQGIDLIDIGAESSRPNCKPISFEEEISRFSDIVAEIKKKFNITVSVDTTKAKVAEYLLNQGADLINDVSNLSDNNIAKIVAKFNASYCLTYNVKHKHCKNLLDDLKLNLNEKLDNLVENGVSKNKIMFDPGIGFNKTFDENLLILKNISRIVNLGLPVLVGASNKSFIGQILKKDVKLRQVGTIATSAILAYNHVNFIRVHNIESNIEAIKIANAMRSC